MEYQSALTTVEAVTRQLEKAIPGDSPAPATAEYDEYYDYLVNNAIPPISGFIQAQCSRSFVPYVEARMDYFWWLINEKRIGRGIYFLDEDLAVINSVRWNGTLLEATDYLPGPSNTLPYNKLMFNPMSGLFWWWGYDFQAGIEIDGTWGYITNTAQAYTSLVSITGTLNDSETTIAVPDATIFETLQYIKIDDEMLQVLMLDTTEMANVIVVLRGVNGTTAAAHTNPYTIRRFNIDPTAQMIATRMAAFAYQRRNDSAGRTQYVDASTLLAEMPAYVAAMLTSKKRIQVRIA